MSRDVPTGLIALTGVLLLILAILFLPITQAVLYGMFIANPATLYWLIIGLGLTAILMHYRPSETVFLGCIAFTVIMALFIGPFVADIQAKQHMSQTVEQDVLNADTELPETSEEHMRVLPRAVADNYADSSMQHPQYQLTSSDITNVNGTYRWSYGVVPDNPMVSWFGQQRGAMYVNMEMIDKSAEDVEAKFDSGRSQIWFDNYGYQSVLKSPFVQHNWETTFNSEHDGTPYIAHSTTKHNWNFGALPLPQPYAVPEHGSVEVMEQNGSIGSLSPDEAAASERLEGENFYPYHIAKFKVNSMKYRNGALNKFFWKEDVLAIANLPDHGNDWPLTVPTQSGNETDLTYFIATEPTGSGDGVYEIWTFNGQTGESAVQQYNNSQIGPQKSVDYVERQPNVNRLSSADAVAPIPVVKDGTLYWHVKVIPQSETGVTYTSFVNAESGDVTLIEGTDQIYKFLSEDQVDEIDTGVDSPESNENGIDVTLVITDEDGDITETRNVTVPENGSVDIGVDS